LEDRHLLHLYNLVKEELVEFRGKQEQLEILIKILEMFREIKQNCFEKKAVSCIDMQIEKVHLLLKEVVSE
jgi:hypothetical protein